MQDSNLRNRGYYISENSVYHWISVSGAIDGPPRYPDPNHGPSLGTRKEVDELIADLEAARDRVFP